MRWIHRSYPPQPVNDRWYLLVLVVARYSAQQSPWPGVFLLEFLDDRLVDIEQIQQVTGLTTLGTVPDIKLEAADQTLVMLHTPHSTDAELFVLRTNLLFASVDYKLNSLLVTSPTPAEGKYCS